MLKLSIEAQLPLVAVTTRDTLNLASVLHELSGKHAIALNPKSLPVEKHKLLMYVCPPREVTTSELPYATLYEHMVKAESTLIIVNPPRIDDLMFNAGEAPVPKPLLMKFMQEVVEDKGKATALLQGLGGCTIKEAAELSRLTMARDKSLTPKGVMDTRKSSFQGSSGLTQVETRQDFYKPPQMMIDWIKKEKQFFLVGTDGRLIPRGLLFDGEPGTGKSAGAKYIAEQIGVPLYRMDIGGTKNKYVGQSEQNLLTNLSRLDHEEPAVALLDEVEKVFAQSNNDTSGTTSTMLSQLLWWLAERKSRVLLIMTTNNAKALPKELYREGRVDQVMMFNGLDEQEAVGFAVEILKTFKLKETPDQMIKWAAGITKPLFPVTVGAKSLASQAAVTKGVYEFMKLQFPIKAA